MIAASDMEFHPPAAGEPAWAEVISCGFSVPARDLNVRVYLLFRPQFGVVQSSITIIGGDALVPWHADYADFRPHLPIPSSLSSFRLANGLTFETLAPHAHWRLAYDDGEGTAFDVRFDALMAPYSPFDPADNPLAGDKPALVDHFEQSGRYIGWLSLRGERFAVDSIRIMNHGWGPRRDRNFHGPTGQQGRTWLHAHFQDGYGVFGMWSFDLERPDTLKLLYGYALDQGKVAGLLSGTASVRRDGDRYPIAVTVDVNDRDGGEHRLAAQAIHRSLWSSWPNMTTFCVFSRWEAEGRSGGLGDVLDFTEIASLTGLHAGRRGSAAPPSSSRQATGER